MGCCCPAEQEVPLQSDFAVKKAPTAANTLGTLWSASKIIENNFPPLPFCLHNSPQSEFAVKKASTGVGTCGGLRYKSCQYLGRLVLTKLSSPSLPFPNRIIVLAKIYAKSNSISANFPGKSLLWKPLENRIRSDGVGACVTSVGAAGTCCSWETNVTLLSPTSSAIALQTILKPTSPYCRRLRTCYCC